MSDHDQTAREAVQRLCEKLTGHEWEESMRWASKRYECVTCGAVKLTAVGRELLNRNKGAARR